jgi:tetratricopeptide (TPR) repeat protein
MCGCGEGPQVAADAIVLEAQEAVAVGDQAKALELLSRSIEINPSYYAYSARAKIYLDQGDAAAALADCEAGLALFPAHADLLWLQGEAKKPADDRFQGENAEPPSSFK